MSEQIIPHTVPHKHTWGEGPWQQEPDFARLEHAGFPGILLRQESSGHWCGYVGVPPGHPWHGKDDSTVYEEGVPEPVCHGGITYGRPCAGSVCHVPKPGEPENVWWLGFDCAHGGDLSPGHAKWRRENGFDRWHDEDVYRDQTYVTAQVKRLAEQARACAT